MRIRLVDFDEPTLLILGEPTSFLWLAERLESRQALDFATTPSVDLFSVGVPVEGDGDLFRHHSEFHCKVSQAEALEFAQQLRVLAASEEPAHAYLDSKSCSAGVQIVASLGEYDDVAFGYWTSCSSEAAG